MAWSLVSLSYQVFLLQEKESFSLSCTLSPLKRMTRSALTIVICLLFCCEISFFPKVAYGIFKNHHRGHTAVNPPQHIPSCQTRPLLLPPSAAALESSLVSVFMTCDHCHRGPPSRKVGSARHCVLVHLIQGLAPWDLWLLPRVEMTFKCHHCDGSAH